MWNGMEELEVARAAAQRLQRQAEEEAQRQTLRLGHREARRKKN